MNWQKQKNFWKRKNLYIVPFWIFGRQRAWGATIIAMLPPQQVLELKWAWYQYTSSIFWREDLYQHTHTHSHTIHTCCYCTYANIQKCRYPNSWKITTIGVPTNMGLSVAYRRWRSTWRLRLLLQIIMWIYFTKTKPSMKRSAFVTKSKLQRHPFDSLVHKAHHTPNKAVEN